MTSAVPSKLANREVGVIDTSLTLTMALKLMLDLYLHETLFDHLYVFRLYQLNVSYTKACPVVRKKSY